MSLSSRKDLLERIKRGRTTRAKLVANNLSEGIAFQIRATRDAQGLSQGELAERLGMTQGNLSRLENPDYGKQTIGSLIRVAEALDVALVVRFEPFSKYIDWLSGTPHLDRGVTPEALSVPGFTQEEESGSLDAQVPSYFPVTTSQSTTVTKFPPSKTFLVKGTIGGRALTMDRSYPSTMMSQVS